MEVESSVIRRVLYRPVFEELYVEFVKTGQVYRYTPVAPWMYVELMNDESIGSCFSRRIKKLCTGTKVDPESWREVLEGVEPKPMPTPKFFEQLKAGKNSV
ncbi:KTSC domain-containing protein, partial [Arthrospira platensis SPKY2]